MNTDLHVVVTRVGTQADSWCAQLNALGWQAQALPLILILPPTDESAVRLAWAELARYDGVVFVSPSAIQGFFALAPLAQAVWPSSTWVALPGPGSQAQLLESLAGVRGAPHYTIVPAGDAAQLDSEHLWPAMQAANPTWQGKTVLLIGGGDDLQGYQGRVWLGDQIEAAGAQVEKIVAYRRAVPPLDAPMGAQLRKIAEHPARYGWLFSSSLAIDNLEDLLRQCKLTALPGQSMALCTHPKIAQRARLAGFARVEACQPSPTQVHQSLLQLQSRSAWL